MVQLASLIACQALGEHRVMPGAALAVGVTPVEVKEIVYQAVPYVGMGKVFDFTTLPTTSSPSTASGWRSRVSRPPRRKRARRRPVVQKQIVGEEGVS